MSQVVTPMAERNLVDPVDVEGVANIEIRPRAVEPWVAQIEVVIGFALRAGNSGVREGFAEGVVGLELQPVRERMPRLHLQRIVGGLRGIVEDAGHAGDRIRDEVVGGKIAQARAAFTCQK